jgi:type II secretory pathway predicted ATPase ExeA
MYLEHFQLKELPFRLSPDPAFLYPSPVHSRAKAYMESTIWFTDGFVIITGEIGSGKTTLIETFLKEIDKDVVVAQLNQTQVSPIEFLQTMLAQFGFTPFKMKKAELITTLNSFLIEQYANGRKVLLIIDEAQNLSNKVLEEVRLLSGVETTKEKVLRIILAGQPELNAKIDSPELMQLRQRVRLRFHLSALSEQDTVNYIEHRLQVAGSNGRALFTPETYPVIYRYSGGIPRLINTLCDTALIAAFVQDHTTIGEEDLQAAITELQWVEYGATPMSKRAGRGRHRHAHAAAGRPAGARTAGCRGERGAARAGTVRDRADHGQRPADRQQVREPASRPDRHDARRQLDRGPEQHQRHLRARSAHPALEACRRRRGQDRRSRADLPADRRAGSGRRVDRFCRLSRGCSPRRSAAVATRRPPGRCGCSPACGRGVCPAANHDRGMVQSERGVPRTFCRRTPDR